MKLHNQKQIKIIQDCIAEIQDNEMPLSTYTFIYSEAKLNDSNKTIPLDWFNDVQKESEKEED